MSRDFDARVRDLHEAPLDISSVKGKAHKIKRNRRAAVAGGVLGVAAIVTPIAVLATDGDTRSREPDFAPEPTTSETASGDVDRDYIVNGLWYRADGEVVQLPKNAHRYEAAVIWDDQLVATRWDGEVFGIADVIDAEGDVADSFDVAGDVEVNDAGTTIAWVDPDGSVMTAWDDEQLSLGTVDMAAPGETVAWAAVAITGGPTCAEEADGCTVFVDSSLGEEPIAFSSNGDQENPVPDAIAYRDVSSVGGARITYQDTLNEDNTVCTGLYDLDQGSRTWHTCDYDAQAISPDGQYVVGAPNYASGLGHGTIAILDAATGEPLVEYPTERGGHISSDVAWSASNTLLFAEWDGKEWTLVSLDPVAGAATELEHANGDEISSPFTLIQH